MPLDGSYLANQPYRIIEIPDQHLGSAVSTGQNQMVSGSLNAEPSLSFIRGDAKESR
jgi:hypothetical protein